MYSKLVSGAHGICLNVHTKIRTENANVDKIINKQEIVMCGEKTA